jgi:hypothetical protein
MTLNAFLDESIQQNRGRGCTHCRNASPSYFPNCSRNRADLKLPQFGDPGDRYTIGGLESFDVMPVTAGRYVSGNIAVWRSGRRGSYVNDMVGNRAHLSGRYHCGLDRRAWIWADALD